ncbi:MAG: hypothetical protein JNN30_12405 [Rhodanobacteraceae bacterium]|nr:hypothetical protein [Rhodanobacteraceae bacterium]
MKSPLFVLLSLLSLTLPGCANESPLSLDECRELSRIEFDLIAKDRGLDSGSQTKLDKVTETSAEICASNKAISRAYYGCMKSAKNLQDASACKLKTAAL